MQQAQICRLRRVFQHTSLPAIRWPWCSTPTGSTTPRCRRSPASSICPRRCSSCRRRTRRTAPGCASSRRCTNCPSPATRPSARRSPSPRRPAATAAVDLRAGGKGRAGALRRLEAARTACLPNSTCRGCPSRWRSPADAGGGRRRRSASTRTRSASRTMSCRPIPAACPTSWCRSPGSPPPARADLDTRAWMALTGPAEALSPAAFVYCRETVGAGNAFHARMFAGHLGIPEDPATGSAVASFAGAIMRFDRPVDGVSRYPIEQGVEMGRPSLIRLELDVQAGRAGRRAHRRQRGQGQRRHAAGLRAAGAPAEMPVRKGWTGRWSASISRRSPQGGCGCVAQLVEQLTLNQRVTGSIPVAPTKFPKKTKHLAEGPGQAQPRFQIRGHFRGHAENTRPEAAAAAVASRRATA